MLSGAHSRDPFTELIQITKMLKAGARNTGVLKSSLLHKKTEDVQREIDAKGNQQGGTIDGIGVPVPASVQT